MPMAPPVLHTSEPRRRRYRKGRVAELPKMNNSERGKYYRQKYKEHELALEHSVVALRRQVHDLNQFMWVKHELAYRNPYDPCESIAGTIYAYYVRDRAHGLQFDASFHTATPSISEEARTSQRLSANARSSFDVSRMEAMMRAWGTQEITNSPREMPITFLRFELLSFGVEGCVDAPVVVVRGTLHAKYTRAAIDRLFPHLFHYQELLEVLLDKDVRYPCTYHFYFGAGGKLEHKIVEADYVHGLQQVVGNLEDVRWLLEGSHRYTEHRDSLEEIMRGPSPMQLDYNLTW